MSKRAEALSFWESCFARALGAGYSNSSWTGLTTYFSFLLIILKPFKRLDSSKGSWGPCSSFSDSTKGSSALFSCWSGKEMSWGGLVGVWGSSSVSSVLDLSNYKVDSTGSDYYDYKVT